MENTILKNGNKIRDDVRRTARILQIDEMFRGGNFVKMDDLIFKFGVKKRTIERDFERLRDEMNAPIEYDKIKKNVSLYESEFFY